MNNPNAVKHVELKGEGSVTSPGGPSLIWQQAAVMSRTFGPINSVRSLLNKFIGESDDIAFQLTAAELEHPLELRRTHSELSSIVDVFGRRIYDLPEGIREEIGSQPIVDIGAYNGTTPAFFASHYPDSHVLAIEPNPRNWPLLHANAKRYAGQITAFHAAAVPYSGRKVSMKQEGFASDSMQNAFVFADREHPPFQPTIVAVTPRGILDLINSETIGMLKVDIEGAERDLFRSPAIDELLRRTGVLLIETHDQFAPGASETVHDAATRNGLELAQLNPHTDIYTRY